MTKREQENEQLTEAMSSILLAEKLNFEILNSHTGEIIIPANRRITKTVLRKLAEANRDGLRLRCVSRQGNLQPGLAAAPPTPGSP